MFYAAILLRPLPKTMLLALVAVLTASATQAGELLSGRELHQLFPGRFQAVVHGAFFATVTAHADGSLLAEFMNRADSGHWSIRSGELCIKFSRWLGGQTSCSKVVQEAGWYRSSKVVFREAEATLAKRSANP